MASKGLLLSRKQLLSLVGGYDFYEQTRTVDVHVAHLRKQLEASTSGRILVVPKASLRNRTTSVLLTTRGSYV